MLMKPFDAVWFYAEKPDAPAHFAPLMILSRPEGAPEDYINQFVEQWRSCKQFAPPFNYVLNRKRVPTWDVLPSHKIDLDHHFRHSALPAPGGERELGILISRLHSHKLDRRRPLWECHVIEGLENNRFAIYLKLHHGQMDGVGAARLMSRVFSADPNTRNMLPPWSIGMQTGARKRLPIPKPSLYSDIRKTFGTFSAVGKELRGLAKEAYIDRKEEVAAPYQAPMTIFNGRVSGQRRIATQHYKLARLKKVAKASDSTVNDIFLTMASISIARYLKERSSLPEEPLIAQVPVSVRAAEDSSVGNSIAFIYVRLATHLEDPLECLEFVRRSVSAGKARQKSLPTEAVSPFTMLLAGAFMGQVIMGVTGKVKPAVNLVASNVPGPPVRMYFNGAQVEQIYGPSVLFHGQALNITMSSYADGADITVTGCRESLPSMQNLAVYGGEALEQLENCFGIEQDQS